MRRLGSILIAASLAGCAIGPNYRRPALSTPEQFYGQAGAAQPGSLSDLPWWEIFGDPVLRPMVEEALRNGFDARIVAARVEEARARFGIAEAAFYPQVGYQGQVARQQASGYQAAGGRAVDNWTVNAGASWELDIWGRIRRLNESAKAQYLATEEARRGVRLSLVSDVATAYFDLRSLDEQLAIARSSRAAFQDTYDLFNRRLEGGAASALETARAAASLATVSAQIPLLEGQIVAKENQIDLLLGRGPGVVRRDSSGALQPSAPGIPSGLPSALLLRRPDLREAEQRLIAANANVGVAKAAFLPTLSLTGLFGGLSPELSDLVTKGKTWSVGGGLLGPIFQGGRLRNQYRATVAQWEQAKLQYEQRVTNALGEVSTSLVALQKLAEAEQEQARAVAADQEAVRLATLRYTAGRSAYFEVLDAMQQLLSGENVLARTHRDRLVALVQFYKALGGGWQAEAQGNGKVGTQGAQK